MKQFFCLGCLELGQIAKKGSIWLHLGHFSVTVSPTDIELVYGTCTQEPGPVLGKLDPNRSLVWDQLSTYYQRFERKESNVAM